MLCLFRLSNQNHTAALALVMASMVCVSCNGAQPTDGQVATLPTIAEAGFEEGTISVTGRVILNGTPADPDTIVKVGGDAYCKAHGAIKTERWKIGADAGFADVVITVDNAPATPISKEKSVIRQENCVYLPHVSAIGAGESVTVRNDDGTYHNVRVVEHQLGTLNKGKNIENYGQPMKGSRHVHRFAQPGVYRLECDVHRWMRSWVFVHSNNHTAVTTEDGNFSIDYGLKDGTYRVSAWHSQFANPVTQEIEIVDGKGQADFAFDVANAIR